MRRFFILIVSAALAAGLSGFSLFKNENAVFQKGDKTWVRLGQADKSLRGTLDHPAALSEDQIKAALGHVAYFKPSAFSFKKDEGKEYDILTQQERDLFAPYLVQAFERVTPEQWVDFSFECFRGQGFIGVYRLTSGVMFVKDGELHIAFRDLGSRTNPEETVLETNPLKNPSSYVRLVPGEGQRLAVTKGRRKEITHENWIIMPLDSLEPPAAAAEPPAPAPAAPSAGPVPAPAPLPAAQPGAAPAPPAEVKKPAKERMLDLRELYDAGLITEEEYERKRKEILEDL